MESCNAVEKEVDKVISKLMVFKKYSSSTLQELIDSVSHMEQDFESGASFDVCIPGKVKTSRQRRFELHVMFF